MVYLVAFFPKASAKIRQKTLYAFDAFDAKLIRQQFGIKKRGCMVVGSQVVNYFLSRSRRGFSFIPNFIIYIIILYI